MHLYKKLIHCGYYDMLARLMVFGSGSNFTLKVYESWYYDYLHIPILLDQVKSSHFYFHYKYSSPVFHYYQYPCIIYCFNLGKVTIAETNIWMKYVPLNIWGLVGLFILTYAFLITPTRSLTNVVQYILQYTILLLNSYFKLLRIILRQSWGQKWKLLGLLELCFCILTAIYENTITVSVVVPLVPKAFSNTKDLFTNNYTFVVQEYGFESANDWLSSKYNKTRVLGVEHFSYLSTWLEKYFLTKPNEIKLAIVGYLSKHFHFPAVTYLKEKMTLAIKCTHPRMLLTQYPSILRLHLLRRLHCKRVHCCYKLTASCMFLKMQRILGKVWLL